MAQIHALLLISAEPLTTEEVMEELQVSRGNANINLRELINWQLVKGKQSRRTERFCCGKICGPFFASFLRKEKREIDPMIQIIHQ
ncbi:MAG: hypothetical protein IPH42_07215 [Bacteroidetes bacterium]|nr:hypothetical protein [Bacteroidota bacterium]